MYKDKEAQKQANKEAAQRKRDKNRGIVKIGKRQDCAGEANSVIPIASYLQNVIPLVIPESNACVIPEITYNSNGAAGRPNRVSVPGDSDYVGCCKLDESGSWFVDNSDTRTAPVLTDEMLGKLPPQVAHPYSGRTLWTNTVEYSQTIYNLLTMTVEQLQAIEQFIPCWKLQGEQAQ